MESARPASPEQQKANEALRTHWGSEYEQKFELASTAVSELFGDRKELLAEITELAPELGNDPAICDALARLGAALKGRK